MYLSGLPLLIGNASLFPDYFNPQGEYRIAYEIPSDEEKNAAIQNLIIHMGVKVSQTIPSMPCLEFLGINRLMDSLCITNQPMLKTIVIQDNIKALTISDCPVLTKVHITQLLGAHLILRSRIETPE